MTENLFCLSKPFSITVFKYQPNKKLKSIEERRKAFQDKLKNWALYNDVDKKEYPDWLRKDFFEYWTEFANDNGRKMRFEMEKTWNTGRRLATAKKTIYSKDPRWNQQGLISGFKIRSTQGNYSPIDYEKAQENRQEQEIRGNLGSILKSKWDS